MYNKGLGISMKKVDVDGSVPIMNTILIFRNSWEILFSNKLKENSSHLLQKVGHSF